jgi:phosphonate degradation associated HDIG domain protein
MTRLPRSAPSMHRLATQHVQTTEELVERVLRLLDERGRTHYDERVTQLEHALQAGQLARSEGASNALVVAALLHDIGHLLLERPAGDRDLQHEVVGARFLRRWFGPEVSAPVALRVAAKRYLVGRDPAYAATLSPASARSLALQGGPFDAAARANFARLPHAESAIAVRRWDDRAKVPGLPVPPLASFVSALWRAARVPRGGNPGPRPAELRRRS